MRRSCSGGGEVLDDQYRAWRYPNGIEPEKCRCCDAVRKPVVQEFRLGWPPTKYDDTEYRLVYPYHKRVVKG